MNDNKGRKGRVGEIGEKGRFVQWVKPKFNTYPNFLSVNAYYITKIN